MKLDTTALHSAAAVGDDDDLGGDGVFAAPSFDLPSCDDFDGFQKNAKETLKHAEGTTTLAFIFKEGVIVAADSRASMGGYICWHSFRAFVWSQKFACKTTCGFIFGPGFIISALWGIVLVGPLFL